MFASFASKDFILSGKCQTTVRVVLLLLVMLFAKSLAANADEEQGILDFPIEELGNYVTSVNFYDVELTNAPGAVYVIGETELNNNPAVTLADHLSLSIPGLHLGFHERYGPNLGTRGILKDISSNTLVMYNGQGVNQRNFWGYMAGLNTPLLGDLKQIEVIQGPGAIVHGSGAISGFINLVPKNGMDNPGSHVSAQYGFVENLKKLEISHGLSYGNQNDLFVYAGIVQADGFNFDDDLGALASTQAADLLARRDANVGGYPLPNYKLSLNLNHGNFSLTSLLQKMDSHVNTTELRHDLDSTWHQALLAISPSYTWNINNNESLLFTINNELFDYGIENRKNFAIVLPDARSSSSGGKESHQELKLTLQSNRFNDHNLVFGGLIGYRDFTSGEHFLSSDPRQPFFAAMDTEWLEYAVFFQDEYIINTKTTLTLSGRYDYVSYSEIDTPLFAREGIDPVKPDNNGRFSPRISLLYKLHPEHKINLSYQEGFHYPDAAQFLNWARMNDELANLGATLLADPRPETLKSFEINWDGIFLDNQLNVKLNLYYNIYEDLLLFTDFSISNRYSQAVINAIEARFNDRFGANVNAEGDFSSLGTELSVLWNPSHKFQYHFSYAYSKPTDINSTANDVLLLASADRDEWARYPTHQIRNSFDYKPTSQWHFNISTLFESGIQALDSIQPRSSDSNNDYFRLNLSANYQFSDKLAAQFIAKNVTGNDTPAISFVTFEPWKGNLGTDERLFYLGLRYDF